ncbi:MAG TPA: hypothetical protein VGN87_03095 [Paenibacillus sp.]
MGKALLDGEIILAVDFDGTISTEPDMGHALVLQPNCKQVLERFYEDGVRLILWTCRTAAPLEEALAFLEANELGHIWCAINDQLPEVNAIYEPNVARKVGADIYIDDKSIGYKVDWLAIEKHIYGE